MAQKPNSIVPVEFHSSAPGGGLQKAENLPAGVLDYILSENIDQTLGKIRASGGTVLMPKTEIPGMGWFAVFNDPTGIALAVYEAQPRPRAARAKPRRAAKKASARGRKRGRRSR